MLLGSSWLEAEEPMIRAQKTTSTQGCRIPVQRPNVFSVVFWASYRKSFTVAPSEHEDPCVAASGSQHVAVLEYGPFQETGSPQCFLGFRPFAKVSRPKYPDENGPQNALVRVMKVAAMDASRIACAGNLTTICWKQWMLLESHALGTECH